MTFATYGSNKFHPACCSHCGPQPKKKEKDSPRIKENFALLDPLVTGKREPPRAESPTPGFLRPAAAAAYLSISPSLLAKLVRMGQGPRQRRCGRAVLYKIADLDSFMEAACS